MTSPAIVDISSDGLIKTTSSSGTAVVQITSHEDFGLNQTAVLSVEVKLFDHLTFIILYMHKYTIMYVLMSMDSLLSNVCFC